MRASQRSTVPEGQIAYGFKGKPIDQPRVAVFRNVPEENLYALNSKVIEFKKPNYSAESEFDIDDSDEDQQAIAISHRAESRKFNSKCASYSDIGYLEAMPNDRKFVNVPISTTPDPRQLDVIDPECFGQIIRIEDDENSQIRQILSEHGYSQCPPQEIMTR